MGLQVIRGLDRIAGYGLNRFGSVGEPGGVPEVGIVSIGDNIK
jgi:hypothetical protein